MSDLLEIWFPYIDFLFFIFNHNPFWKPKHFNLSDHMYSLFTAYSWRIVKLFIHFIDQYMKRQHGNALKWH